MSEQALNKIKDIQRELNLLNEKKDFFQARKVINSLIRLLDSTVLVEDQDNFQLFTDSDGKIRANGSWFYEDPIIIDRKATYKVYSNNNLNIDFKLYGIKKPIKRTISWVQALTPNFEDEPFNKNFNVGIDFIIPESFDRVIVVLSNNWIIRTLELKGELTATYQEIFAKWTEIKHFDSKEELHKILWDSFDISPLNKKFYAGISERFNILRQYLVKNNVFDEKHAAFFTNRLLGRIIFCWFLNKKGIINTEFNYFNSKIFADDNKYYKEKLEKLFFEVLNTPAEERRIGDNVTPFLNGGLFEARKNDLYRDAKLTFPKNYFDDLYGFLLSYNFTTDESTSQFQQVAIDPEMLGRIFENLLAEMTEETGEQARKAKGAFYTPREIVDYMCKESLKEHLKTKLREDEFRDQRLYQLIEAPDKDFQDQDHNWRRDWKPYKEEIIKALDELKVLDPACGSGAFPIGMLQLLVRVYERLESRFDSYKTKLGIIEKNIYGVDIEPMAVEISRLRTWLSIIVDEEADSKKIKPLPNLEFKFVCANSLIGLDKNTGVLGDDSKLDVKLQNIRDAYFNSENSNKKKELKLEYEKLISKQEGLFGESLRSKQLKTYRPFDSEVSAKFFNAEFIFGLKKFNIIIGNPPYVGEKKHKEIFRNIAGSEIGQRFYERKMDLFYFFFHMALDYLQDQGLVTYITTNYYLTATSAVKLRTDIKKRSSVIQLINFGELKIFRSAYGQHNIITILKKGFDKNIYADTAITERKGFSDHNIISLIVDKKDDKTHYYKLNQDELFEDNNIKLTNGKLDIILSKIKKSKNNLSEICDINMGVQTGADNIGKDLYYKAEKYNKKRGLKIGDKIYVLSNIENFSDVEKREILKKHIKSSAITKYHLDLKQHEWLIYVDSQVDINKYKNIKKHLLKYREILSLREQVGNTEETWFRIRGAKRKYFINTGKHIICPYRSKSNNFAITDGKTYGSGDVYLLTGIKYQIESLLGILNSYLIFVWLYNRGKRKGAMLELYKEPLSNIPIPKINKENESFFKKIAELTLEVIQIKNNNKKKDTTNLEDKINEYVMDLYELTEEEKKEIIKNIKK